MNNKIKYENINNYNDSSSYIIEGNKGTEIEDLCE